MIIDHGSHISWQPLYSVTNWCLSLTKSKLLSSIRGKSEAKQSHGRDGNTGNNEIEEVIKSSSPHVDGEGDVNIWLWTTFIHNTVPFSRHSWQQKTSFKRCSNNCNIFLQTYQRPFSILHEVAQISSSLILELQVELKKENISVSLLLVVSIVDIAFTVIY